MDTLNSSCTYHARPHFPGPLAHVSVSLRARTSWSLGLLLALKTLSVPVSCCELALREKEDLLSVYTERLSVFRAGIPSRPPPTPSGPLLCTRQSATSVRGTGCQDDSCLQECLQRPKDRDPWGFSLHSAWPERCVHRALTL